MLTRDSTGTRQMILIELQGQPQGKGRPRFVRRGRFVSTYTPTKTRKYEQALAERAIKIMNGQSLLREPLRVNVVASFAVPPSWPRKRRDAALVGVKLPTTRPDYDNLLKILDALNGIVWHDDAQIVEATVRKCYSESPSLRDQPP